MNKQTSLILLILFAFITPAYCQPKRIKSKEDYMHKRTGMVFPLTLGEYARTDIYTFDKKKENIGINYKGVNSNNNTRVTIYLYPAGEGTEDRLRSQYAFSLQSVANVSDNCVYATQYAVSYKNSGYKINGFKADINQWRNKSSLSLYECGHWFFKIRITSDDLDSVSMSNLEQQLLEKFVPTNLVKNDPLNPKASVYMSKAAYADSVMLGSAMGSAYAKIDWAFQHVDSLERASGFPGMYLELHVTALKGFLAFEKEHQFKKSKQSADYLNELNAIADNNFLNEFVMEQYNMVMITPENMKVDFEAFDLWKDTHPVKINLREIFYVISFK